MFGHLSASPAVSLNSKEHEAVKTRPWIGLATQGQHP